MARNAGDVLVKRNSKLESFLKKNLDEDTFQRIRCHEACIVCSDTEDKAYKFVVLTDDWIYLTENPPKKVQPIVHLGDVLSVELVSLNFLLFEKNRTRKLGFFLFAIIKAMWSIFSSIQPVIGTECGANMLS